MSIQAIAWVLEFSHSRLAARLVLICIANHAHADGSNSYPSFNTIAREGHLSRSEVIRSIQELERGGELSVEREAGPHGTNMYSLPRFMEARRDQLVAKRDQLLVSSGAQLVASGVQASRQKRPEPSFNRTKPKDIITISTGTARPKAEALRRNASRA